MAYGVEKEKPTAAPTFFFLTSVSVHSERSLKATMEPTVTQTTAAAAVPYAMPVNPPQFRKTRSAEFFRSGRFKEEVARFRKYANCKTGFSNIDDIQPLYPGLYVLGATSGLGKTTFSHQLTDQIASTGQQVLYFALEQSSTELLCKSLARGFYQVQRNIDPLYPAPDSTSIRNGYAEDTYPDQLQEQVDRFTAEIEDNVEIIDDTYQLTVEGVAWIIEDYIATNHVVPVIIIDYIQIIQPTVIEGRALEPKAAMDHIIETLKMIQKRHGNTIIGISSLNRASYMYPVDFESFKESGIIEYTCDVVWGLQLSLLETDEYMKERTAEKKRLMVKSAKAEIPRLAQLSCLKNRFGRTNYTVCFDYYPDHDTFIPIPWGGDD